MYIDYTMLIDVCGWEKVEEPSADSSPTLIPYSLTYFVEVGTNRSNTTTFTDYTTNSTNYPSWHPEPTHKQCDISEYSLTASQSSSDTYSA